MGSFSCLIEKEYEANHRVENKSRGWTRLHGIDGRMSGQRDWDAIRYLGTLQEEKKREGERVQTSQSKRSRKNDGCNVCNVFSGAISNLPYRQ